MNKGKVTIKALLIVFLLVVAVKIKSQDVTLNPLLVINTYNQKGAPEKAIQFYNSKNIETQLDSKMQFALGTAFYLEGDYKQAANLFIKVNVDDNKLANFELAQCYACLNKPDIAIKYLHAHLSSKDKKMQRTIKSDKAFMNIEKSNEWKILWSEEWYSKYDLMLEDAWYEYENENFEEALSIVDALNAIRKSMVKAYQLKALLYLKLGEPENALSAINTAIEKRNKIADFYETKAAIQVELNKPKKALKTIAIAIEMDSAQANYYFIRAQANMKKGDLTKAVKDLDAMIALVPDFDIYKLAGEIYFEGGEYQMALKAYNKCIALHKYDSDIYIARGDVFESMYAYEFAEKDYTMALDFQPYNGELFYKRGQARKMQNKTDLACSDFNQAYRYKYMKADDELRGYCQGR